MKIDFAKLNIHHYTTNGGLSIFGMKFAGAVYGNCMRLVSEDKVIFLLFCRCFLCYFVRREVVLDRVIK